MKLAEALKKFFRAIQRELIGESNRLVVTVPVHHRGSAASMTASVPNPDNRLQYEQSKVVVEGSRRDIHRIRCLDNVIGGLSVDFNAKAAAKLERHVQDLSESLKRIRAYKVEGDKKTPVDRLEYKVTTLKIAPVA